MHGSEQAQPWASASGLSGNQCEGPAPGKSRRRARPQNPEAPASGQLPSPKQDMPTALEL